MVPVPQGLPIFLPDTCKELGPAPAAVTGTGAMRKELLGLQLLGHLCCTTQCRPHRQMTVLLTVTRARTGVCPRGTSNGKTHSRNKPRTEGGWGESRERRVGSEVPTCGASPWGARKGPSGITSVPDRSVQAVGVFGRGINNLWARKGAPRRRGCQHPNLRCPPLRTVSSQHLSFRSPCLRWD